MRLNHIIGGQIIFGIGLFLVYLNSFIVFEIFKGVMQPITIFLGLVALSSAIFGKAELRKPNAIAAGALLVIGAYGVYDEFYAVLDFFNGFIPIFLILAGGVGVGYGIKKIA
ncbi:MAG: hypothetical protein HQK76_13155 [Desulfobacterales bacterium]|nr:hypothetical protein [Desulfobacterales bacterium]